MARYKFCNLFSRELALPFEDSDGLFDRVEIWRVARQRMTRCVQLASKSIGASQSEPRCAMIRLMRLRLLPLIRP